MCEVNVKLLYVKFVCVKLVWNYCMWSVCVLNYCCMCKEAGGGGEGARDTESKTRTPHKVVGKKHIWNKSNTLKQHQKHQTNTLNIFESNQKTCDKRQVKTNKQTHSRKKSTKTKSCKKNTNFQTNSKYTTELEKPFEKNNTFLFQILEF